MATPDTPLKTAQLALSPCRLLGLIERLPLTRMDTPEKRLTFLPLLPTSYTVRSEVAVALGAASMEWKDGAPTAIEEAQVGAPRGGSGPCGRSMDMRKPLMKLELIP